MRRVSICGVLVTIGLISLLPVVAGVAFVWSGFYHFDGTASSAHELAQNPDLRGLGVHLPPSIRDIRFIVQPYRGNLYVEGSMDCGQARAWVSEKLIISEFEEGPIERPGSLKGGVQLKRIANGFYADGVYSTDKRFRFRITCDRDLNKVLFEVRTK